ncbi:MAG: FAD-dependent oxidoreductase [Polyangiaceae bacterium]
MTSPPPAVLPDDRLERSLPEGKPLFSLSEARAEAERCLYCSDAPCIQACPTEIDIPTFIKKIASDNVRGSAMTIFDQNVLGYSCSRVCPVEVLCEGSCVYTAWQHKPIAIGRLQRFATQKATEEHGPGSKRPLFTAPAKRSGKKVALVGGGPASLACAAYLAQAGHTAVVYERGVFPGGLNTTGVAPYKLHAEDALHEVEFVKSLGVEIRTGVEVGKDVTGKQLTDEYDAVYLGIGLGADSKLGVPGEDGPGVVGAVRWIEDMKLAAAPKGAAPKLGRVIVVGGGNTAIDVVRECAKLGAEEVTLVYRRSEKEMSAYVHETEGAKKDAVRIATNLQPVAVVRDASGKVTALEVARAEGGKPVAGTERELPCDLVVLAIGQAKIKALAAEFPGVTLAPNGTVVVDAKTGRTGHPKVYAGGDCVNGGKEVVNAVAHGRDTARHLDAVWSGRNESKEAKAAHG